MNTPPIPSFEPYSCPNCGLPLPEVVEFCPACGARTDNAQRKPQWLSCLMIGVLALLMAPLGFMGACFLVFAPSSGLGADGLVTGAIGLVLVGAAVLCGIGIKKLRK